MPYVEYDPRYLQGIEHFNNRDFYAAHDAWEDMWLEMPKGEDKDFVQGMILSAVSLLHYGNDNHGGARSRFRAALDYFEGIESPFWDLDLENFLRRMNGALHRLLTEEKPPELNMKVVPTIRLKSV